jgi:hypothetical protein
MKRIEPIGVINLFIEFSLVFFSWLRLEHFIDPTYPLRLLVVPLAIISMVRVFNSNGQYSQWYYLLAVGEIILWFPLIMFELMATGYTAV